MQSDWPLSYYLPKARTNYGKFNICSIGAKLWNAIKEELKSASRFRFKKLLKESLLFFLTSLFIRLCLINLLQLKYFFFVCFLCAFVYL